MKGSSLICKAGLVQRRVQKIAGVDAGEHPSRAVRPMRRGRQSKDQEMRLRVPESLHGLAPVLAFAISAAFLSHDLFAIFHEARAFLSRDNPFAQDAKLYR